MYCIWTKYRKVSGTLTPVCPQWKQQSQEKLPPKSRAWTHGPREYRCGEESSWSIATRELRVSHIVKFNVHRCHGLAGTLTKQQAAWRHTAQFMVMEHTCHSIELEANCGEYLHFVLERPRLEAEISVKISASWEDHISHNRSDCGAHHQMKRGGRRLRNFLCRLSDIRGRQVTEIE